MKNAETNNTIFAERLRDYMMSRHLSFRDMEKITGIPAQTINRYVLGQRVPKIDVIPELAKRLNVSERWLMGIPGVGRLDDDEKEKPTVKDDGLTESQRKLIAFAEGLSDDQIEALIQMSKVFLGKE